MYNVGNNLILCLKPLQAPFQFHTQVAHKLLLCSLLNHPLRKDISEILVERHFLPRQEQEEHLSRVQVSPTCLGMLLLSLHMVQILQQPSWSMWMFSSEQPLGMAGHALLSFWSTA